MQKTLNRTEQLQRLCRRHAGRGKEGKSRLLDEFREQHGYERKYAIKLLGDTRPKKTKGSGLIPLRFTTP